MIYYYGSVMLKTQLLPGAIGQLEALVTEPKNSDPVSIAILCHPHPQQEGTMHNKVVTTMAKAFDACGTVTLRFNFRGIGRSEGVFDNAVGECDDLRAMIAWAQQHYPHLPLSLAGFSFGASIAARVASDDHVGERLISIAPGVDRDYFPDNLRIATPWLVVQGEQDDVAPAEDVAHWWAALQAAPLHPDQSLQILPGVGHFFHGRLIELRELLIAWINSH